MSIIVFGSINMDLVTRSPRLPVPGETLLGYDFFTAPGGKGANQAVGSALLGRTTYMIGRVGNDNFGQELLTSLKVAGVQTDSILIDDTTSSGVAVIAVDDRSENTIIVVPGANGKVNHTDVERLEKFLPNASVLLLQLEVPIPAIIAAAEAAKKAKVKVILDPAPAPEKLPDELYSLTDVITPNETEASRLVGFEISHQETMTKAAEILLSRGVKIVVLKLGSRGVFCATASENFMLPAFPVNAIDTVAAGDAFNAAMAAAFDSDLSLKEAIKWGAAAGALATTKKGAQPSLPNKETFEGTLLRFSATEER
ncbi:ribokinase [Floridanema aerugineum]|uniref:Ribokinase n=1 Tax=Floridaenema aerugineum BLCC-F46 TaxID=3153654 RepID=A0ABV4X8B7_9CYAN